MQEVNQLSNNKNKNTNKNRKKSRKEKERKEINVFTCLWIKIMKGVLSASMLYCVYDVLPVPC